MTVEGRGKLDWASDNQSTASSMVLVYNARRGRTPGAAQPDAQADRLVQPRAVRWSRPRAPSANAVNLLVETVLLNYMALHGEEGNFPTLFPSHGLGGSDAA